MSPLQNQGHNSSNTLPEDQDNAANTLSVSALEELANN